MLSCLRLNRFWRMILIPLALPYSVPNLLVNSCVLLANGWDAYFHIMKFSKLPYLFFLIGTFITIGNLNVI